MRKVLIDAHTHTVASGHAYSSLQEMVRAAADTFIKDLVEYIEYYNNERIKLRLNGMSPVQYISILSNSGLLKYINYHKCRSKSFGNPPIISNFAH